MLLDGKWINQICHHFLLKESPPKETRGGSRRTDKKKATVDSIRNFISQLQTTESHYGRKKISRIYLSSLFNINILYIGWWEKFADEHPDLHPFTYKQFRQIFVTKFNIAFGIAGTDVCSTCVTYQAKIDVKEEDLAETQVQYRLHKLRAKQFHLLQQEAQTQTNLKHSFWSTTKRTFTAYKYWRVSYGYII